MATARKKRATQKELVIARFFNAPRLRVWKAWTEPDRMMRWWGPKGFTCPVCKTDFRIGGRYHSAMLSPDGKYYWSTGVYREIVPLEKIVDTDSFSDEKGNVVPATHYGMSEDFPLELLVTVTLEEQNGKTRLTLQHLGFPSAKDMEDARQGWSESFDKLEAYLEDI